MVTLENGGDMGRFFKMLSVCLLIKLNINFILDILKATSYYLLISQLTHKGYFLAQLK